MFIFDIINLILIFKTPKDIELSLAKTFKKKRLRFNLSQKELSKKTGVALGTLRKFEQYGKASLITLIKISFALGMSDQWLNLFTEKDNFQSMDELLEFDETKAKLRQRATRKIKSK